MKEQNKHRADRRRRDVGCRLALLLGGFGTIESSPRAASPPGASQGAGCLARTWKSYGKGVETPIATVA